VPEARVDPRQPFYGNPIKAKLRAAIRQAEAICEAAATSLKNAVRIQQVHTDLSAR
jgi:enamine deaminase RidA (YjgF/YER057c/UK114 family)